MTLAHQFLQLFCLDNKHNQAILYKHLDLFLVPGVRFKCIYKYKIISLEVSNLTARLGFEEEISTRTFFTVISPHPLEGKGKLSYNMQTCYYITELSYYL